MQYGDRRMMWHGMVLFLLGLITPTLIPKFKNPKMGVSAHLEGVMNGTFLIALGAVSDQVQLPPAVKKVARLSAIYGTYSNWLFTTLGAAMGTNAMNPIVAEGYEGKPWQEKAETAGFISVAVSIIAAAVLAIWGLGRRTSYAEIVVKAADAA